MGGIFAIGFVIAWWDPDPRLILTLAGGLSCGILLLGPYAAAALYTTRLQQIWRGHLRWPLCLLLALSSVACVGTVVGHDATLAVLELRSSAGRVDGWMVGLFPVLVGLSALSGYCSLGFGIGAYQVVRAFVG